MHQQTATLVQPQGVVINDAVLEHAYTVLLNIHLGEPSKTITSCYVKCACIRMCICGTVEQNLAVPVLTPVVFRIAKGTHFHIISAYKRTGFPHKIISTRVITAWNIRYRRPGRRAYLHTNNFTMLLLKQARKKKNREKENG
jgi:hypothetical protein